MWRMQWLCNKRTGRFLLVFLVLCLVATLISSFLTPHAWAYDAPCTVTNVTTGQESDSDIVHQHRYIELTISDEDENVDGRRPYSHLLWLPDSVVAPWRVVPPTDQSVGLPHHWRIVIHTGSFFDYPGLEILYIFNPQAIAYLQCSYPDSPPKGDIGGLVKISGSGVVVTGADVQFIGGGTTGNTTTDGNGRYLFSGVPSGSARITASKTGVGSGFRDVTVLANACKF